MAEHDNDTPSLSDIQGDGAADAGEASGDFSGATDSERTCVVCGYNLQGLSAEGACPECGEPIQRTVEGDPLSYAAPRWVNAIFQGLRNTCYPVMLAAAGFMFLPCAVLQMPWIGPPQPGNSVLVGTTAGIGCLLMALAGLWLLAGVRQVTTPEDERYPHESRMCVRRLSRILAVASAVAVPLPFLSPWLAVLTVNLPLLASVAYFRHCEDLATRVQSPTSARSMQKARALLPAPAFLANIALLSYLVGGEVLGSVCTMSLAALVWLPLAIYALSRIWALSVAWVEATGTGRYEERGPTT